MIVDSYLVNQSPTQSHTSPNPPSNTVLNFELEKMQPSEVSPSAEPLRDNTTGDLTTEVPLCETHVVLSPSPTMTSENPLVLADEFETLDVLSIPLERVSWWITAGIVGGILLTGWLLTPNSQRLNSRKSRMRYRHTVAERGPRSEQYATTDSMQMDP